MDPVEWLETGYDEVIEFNRENEKGPGAVLTDQGRRYLANHLPTYVKGLGSIKNDHECMFDCTHPDTIVVE